ncbi:MAG: NAD(P)-dependent oxidoreductase [Pseudomonadota bacterium]
MLIVQSEQQSIALFGVGLIGSAIAEALQRRTGAPATGLRLRWASQDDFADDLQSVMQALEWRTAAGARPAVVWSAGAGGFGAAESETRAELQRFEQLVGALERLAAVRDVKPDFHLVSSGGGLFEGRRAVTTATQPASARPYSALKLAQEAAITSRRHFRRIRIYRPSSVYGRIRPGHRLGLVSTLIRNGIARQVTHLVGRTHTLRDFVHADDIGGFVAREVLSATAPDQRPPCMLAAGKPSSVQEVQRAIESVLGYRTFISFDLRSNNDADTTFAPNSLPTRWQPRPLLEGVRGVVEDYKSFQPDSWRRRQSDLDG